MSHPLSSRNPVRRSTARGGTSLLEMSLVLTTLIMLTFGVIDYGYYIYLKNTFQGAAQAGARAAVPFAATNASVTGASGVVTNMLTAAGIPSTSYTVTLSPSNISGISAGTQITVSISASWGTVGTHMLGTAFGGISNSKQVTASAVMQKESN